MAYDSHLRDCGCHDSWDQCPCADGGHPADGSCNCCPLGTGLCGPLPAAPAPVPDDEAVFIGSLALMDALYETYCNHIGMVESDGPDGAYMWCECGWRSDDLTNDNPGNSYAIHLTNALHAASVKALQPIVIRRTGLAQHTAAAVDAALAQQREGLAEAFLSRKSGHGGDFDKDMDEAAQVVREFGEGR